MGTHVLTDFARLEVLKAIYNYLLKKSIDKAWLNLAAKSDVAVSFDTLEYNGNVAG